MDEPFGALDEITRDHLNEQLLRLWEQTRKTVDLRHALDFGGGVPVEPHRGDEPASGPHPRDHRQRSAGRAAAWTFARRRRFSTSRTECARHCAPVTAMTTDAAPLARAAWQSSTTTASCIALCRLLPSSFAIFVLLVRLGGVAQRAAGDRSTHARRNQLDRARSGRWAPGRWIGRCCRRRIRSQTNLRETVFNTPIDSKRSLVYHAGVTVSATLLGFVLGSVLGIVLGGGNRPPRACSIAACCPGSSRRRPCRSWRSHRWSWWCSATSARGSPAQGDHLDVPVLLSGDDRHGEGPALARSAAARSDAHL